MCCLWFQEECLAGSFQNFIDYSLSLLRKIRDTFPTTNGIAFTRLEGMLRSVPRLLSFLSRSVLGSFSSPLGLCLTKSLLSVCALLLPPSPLRVPGMLRSVFCSLPSPPRVPGMLRSVFCSLPSPLRVPGMVRSVFCPFPSSLRVPGMVRSVFCSFPSPLRVPGMLRSVLCSLPSPLRVPGMPRSVLCSLPSPLHLCSAPSLPLSVSLAC